MEDLRIHTREKLYSCCNCEKASMETEYLKAVKDYKNKFLSPYALLHWAENWCKVWGNWKLAEIFIRRQEKFEKIGMKIALSSCHCILLAFCWKSGEISVTFQFPPISPQQQKNLFCFSQVFSYSELWTECALIHSVQLSWMCYTQKYTQNWVELNAWVWVYKPIQCGF